MDLKSLIRLFARICLVMTFFVILAGSVVRMTGSGMGCPDWPKCFGHLIPPTDAEELSYSEGKHFSKGQMILMNDTLWVANQEIIAGNVFSRTEWHKYPKHDYAIFNVLHTWVEYVNRLATVVYGIPVFILSLLSLILLIRTSDWKTFLLALFTDIMIAYEIWLGKLVVDGNLKENSISYHMFGSIAIVSLLMLLVYRLRFARTVTANNQRLKWMVLIMVVLSFLQVMLGTQVREEIDTIAKINSDRSVWIASLPAIFKIHRSFSIVVSLLAVMIFLEYRKFPSVIPQVKWMLSVLAIEVLAGVVLSYFSMPSALQPLHLLCGVLMFATSFYSFLLLRSASAGVKAH